MAQRFIEMLIGRLITDERFSADFTAAPGYTLQALNGQGIELNCVETAALVGTDPGVWERAAQQLDPRLQKIDLATEARSEPAKTRAP